MADSRLLPVPQPLPEYEPYWLIAWDYKWLKKR